MPSLSGGPNSDGTADATLVADVARQFYLDGRSKTEIAEELKISRFRVARLLETARRTGIVRIEIAVPGAVNARLSRQVQQAYGLTHSVVLDVPDDDNASLRAALGRATAKLLEDVITPSDAIGLAWARTLDPMGRALTRLPPCPVVQLTGALSRPDGFDVLELVRHVARLGGGPAHVFYAPMIAHDTATARTLRRQPDVARVLSLAKDVTIAAVGIGAWADGLSTVHDAFGRANRQALTRQGAIADVSGIVIDATGQPLHSELTECIITQDANTLRGVETVVAVAYGGDVKARAVHSALRGGLANSLVANRSLAEALLTLARRGAVP